LNSPKLFWIVQRYSQVHGHPMFCMALYVRHRIRNNHDKIYFFNSRNIQLAWSL